MDQISQKSVDEVARATRHYFETGERPDFTKLTPQAKEIWDMRFRMHDDPLSLTPQQIATADLLLDTYDKRTPSAKLKSLQISTQTYQAWMRDAVFQRYMTQESTRRLEASLPDANTALIHKVQSGDSNAIKFYFELTGKFNQTAPELAITITNMQLVISTLLELIQQRLTPAELLIFAHELEARTQVKMATQDTIQNSNLAAQSLSPPVGLSTSSESTLFDTEATN